MAKPDPVPRRREFDLDPFRGVVCLWLMAMHLCWMSEANRPLLRLVPAIVPDLAYHVRLGVEAFLILAGFMAAHMLRPVPGEAVRLGAFCLRRGCRLLIPFGVAVLAAAADRWAAYLLFGGGAGRPSLTDVLAQLLLVNEWLGIPEAAVGYWTLVVLEQAAVVGLVALAVAHLGAAGGDSERYRTAYTRMGPVALALFLGSGAVFLLAPSFPFTLPRFGFYISFGVLLYGRTRLGLFKWESTVALAVLIAVTVLTQHSRLTASLVTVGALSALARGVRFPSGFVFGALRYVGRRSYSVYLVHAIVGIRLLSLSKFLNGYGDWAVVPLIGVAAAASLAGAAVFYRWVEFPCQRLAGRFRYRTPEFTSVDETGAIYSAPDSFPTPGLAVPDGRSRLACPGRGG
jgi:peptidoglycan/LPS O-acetylase OafA/YrhL